VRAHICTEKEKEGEGKEKEVYNKKNFKYKYNKNIIKNLYKHLHYLNLFPSYKYVFL